MKTINEAAQEYGSDIFDEDAFKAGVEFAQKWYNLSDIKPTVKKEHYKILVGGGRSYILSAETYLITSEKDVKNICKMFEFWRPIELS